MRPRIFKPQRRAPSTVGLLLTAIISGLAGPAARADVKLPSFFASHMVLQRDMPIPIWGWANPDEEIAVKFQQQLVKAKADAAGDWKVVLDKAGVDAEPQTVTIIGKNTITLTDVLIGDVWLCSGQSNMGFWLGGASNAADAEAKAADPLLRIFAAGETTSIKPQMDVVVGLAGAAKWRPATAQAVDKTTAVGYFFCRALRADLKIPIGLIASSQGGSKAQMWVSVDAIEKHVDDDPAYKTWLEKRNALIADYPQRAAAYVPLKAKYDQDMKHYRNDVEGSPEYQKKLVQWQADTDAALAAGKAPPPRPRASEDRPKAPEPPDGGPYSEFMVGNSFNAMIAPMVHLAIKGVAWYQGESNDDAGKQYRILFPILIQDWRSKWGQGDFPFLFVQLPNISKPATQPVQETTDHWPWVRDSQAQTLSLPNTGMATTIDVGDPYNVHGKDKVDVGNRLALVARHVVYGEDIVWCGPTYDSMKIDGHQIIITFKNIGDGLKIGAAPWTPSGKPGSLASKLNGFAIAGADIKWAWAKAEIDGDHVVVSSDQVPAPVAVRYGWANNPSCNLYNSADLPATPFRTDTGK